MSSVTLLSDLGLQSVSVASAKGTLLKLVENVDIIDLSHNIEPFHLQQAAYLLASTYNKFPEGTCHLVLFDIFYSNNPQLILSEIQGQYILAPDNGIIPLAIRKEITNVWRCYELTTEGIFEDWLNKAAEVITQLQNKKSGQLGLPSHEIENAPAHCQPKIFDDLIEVQVIHIDRFENVILNITEKEFEEVRKDRDFSISFMRDEVINKISKHYSSVKPGQKLCKFNSAGYMEIAINRGNAAGLFGFRLAKDEQLIYNTIKINFE